MLFDGIWIMLLGIITVLLNPTVEWERTGGRAEAEAIVSYYQ